jgi:hypothetical protein
MSCRHVGTRTVTQVRTHAQKYFLKLAKLQTADGSTSIDGAAASESAENCEGWDGSEDDGAAA